MEVNKVFNENKDSWVIDIIGELDIYTSPKFKELLVEALEERMGNIVINGQNLSYIDSTGLGVLISVLKKVKENDKTITIENIKPNIKKLFDLTSLDKVFVIKE